MKLFTLTGSSENDPRISEWRADHQDELGLLAANWFKKIRTVGTDVSEILHDGYLTACVGDYPFAYVGAFKAHINIGFFQGVDLSDPATILEGTGKRMRHVKLRPGKEPNAEAMNDLVNAAYVDIKQRIGTTDH